MKKPKQTKKDTKPPHPPKKTIKNIKKGEKTKKESFSEKYIKEREEVFKETLARNPTHLKVGGMNCVTI